MNERIGHLVREWPQWSRAERECMEDVIEEVLDHCRNGTGNNFIRNFVNRVIVPQIPGFVATQAPTERKWKR